MTKSACRSGKEAYVLSCYSTAELRQSCDKVARKTPFFFCFDSLVAVHVHRFRFRGTCRPRRRGKGRRADTDSMLLQRSREEGVDLLGFFFFWCLFRLEFSWGDAKETLEEGRGGWGQRNGAGRGGAPRRLPCGRHSIELTNFASTEPPVDHDTVVIMLVLMLMLTLMRMLGNEIPSRRTER